MEHVDVLVMGGGTAGSNAARTAVKEGAKRVVMVHPEALTNTCVEEGCMPSKSILAGAHQHEKLAEVEETRNAHIVRLLKALVGSFEHSGFEEVLGRSAFTESGTVLVTHQSGESTEYQAEKIVIASGSEPFVPPIKGLETIGDKMLVSSDVVSKAGHFNTLPTRLLTVGGGPIGLELSTFFHDMGVEVTVIERGPLLRLYDPEFGEERVRASKDKISFPIHTNTNLLEVALEGEQVKCTIEENDETREELFDAILIATGRKPNLDGLGLEHTDIERDERGGIVHDEFMETSHKGIFIAGDVTGHHQILHFAAHMGKTAGYNAMHPDEMHKMDYDKHMLAVSFDQFPSAMIGLTQTEAEKRGMEVITATRHFNSIGLGILKRQEYGMWKVVAEKGTGKIIGSQILGPDSAGELIQVLVPVIWKGITYGELLEMTWYHPTYAEIIQSLSRDLSKLDKA